MSIKIWWERDKEQCFKLKIRTIETWASSRESRETRDTARASLFELVSWRQLPGLKRFRPFYLDSDQEELADLIYPKWASWSDLSNTKPVEIQLAARRAAGAVDPLSLYLSLAMHV